MSARGGVEDQTDTVKAIQLLHLVVMTFTHSETVQD